MYHQRLVWFEAIHKDRSRVQKGRDLVCPLYLSAYCYDRRLTGRETITKAIDWIHSVQRPDGSWYGSWYVPSSPLPLILSYEGIKGLTTRGICFTYATMFALESLAIAGETHENSAAVRRACDFLVSKQMEDGGWGETYMVSILAALHTHRLLFPLSLLIVPYLSHYRSNTR